MSAPTTGGLRVPGATLYYEVRGRGPLLLLIPGGTGGAAAFDGVADALAAEYTVASYDPRGLSRSSLDEPEAGQSVAEHAEDALRLLDLLSPGEPARVFGSSSGAIAALHLLTARPERLVRLVAHEPPVVEVLPDAPAHRAFLARVRDTLEAEGLMPAMGVFAAGLRSDGDAPAPGPAPVPAPTPAPAELPPHAAARAERTMGDLPYFLGRIVPGFMAYSPDLERLEAVSDRLVLAGGRDSRGELPYRPAAYLAERFGRELLHFPGGHTGLTTHPAEFGGVLRQAFAS
ncbi:alpha/beta fold hydrolase [Streptomyces sp. NBC_01264]|uniref:alpha/beta fold hydrolase n=1 Tax=Streptomyces sp. NBC_01264 TaxID=2903804 RepID=UPI00225564CB|nr:alpha/beta hydrolase [Streptomyces sp. NBC_01264]MCX4780323.1 alpha/beta hydrolase [Streptomyces sp. NBC_01264]